MTASEALLRKTLVGSGLDTSGWNSIQAGLRDRAFFMAEVERVKILEAARSGAADILRSGKSMSEVRRDLRRMLLEDGYQPSDEDRGTIKDLFSKQRLDVMLKTNVDQARGYATHLRATSRGALLAFPGYEFVRVQQRRVPRGDWPQRWQKACRAVNFEGVARGTSRMIALKTSPVWVRLSAFGNPYPPFDFGSGMGLDDVDAETCRELGLGEAAREQKPPMLDFNKNLQAQFDAGHWSGEYAKNLHRAFGDQLRYSQDQKTGNVTVQWQRCLLRDMFENYSPPTPEESGKGWRLGKATAKLLAECDKVSPKYRQIFEGRGLSLSKSIAKHTIDEGHWLVDETVGNMPVKPADLDLVPSLWRSPDYIEAGGKKDSIVLCIETFDGGVLKLPVMVRNMVPTPTGIYKTKAPTSTPASIP